MMIQRSGNFAHGRMMAPVNDLAADSPVFAARSYSRIRQVRWPASVFSYTAVANAGFAVFTEMSSLILAAPAWPPDVL